MSLRTIELSGGTTTIIINEKTPNLYFILPTLNSLEQCGKYLNIVKLNGFPATNVISSNTIVIASSDDNGNIPTPIYMLSEINGYYNPITYQKYIGTVSQCYGSLTYIPLTTNQVFSRFLTLYDTSKQSYCYLQVA